jgi:hypothetical protein
LMISKICSFDRVAEVTLTNCVSKDISNDSTSEFFVTKRYLGENTIHCSCASGASHGYFEGVGCHK